MERVEHGSTSIPEDDSPPDEFVAVNIDDTQPAIAVIPTTPVGFLFPNLANNATCRLPEGTETLADLQKLGKTMHEGNSGASKRRIPSIYTYFSQFIDHDIAFTKTKKTPPDKSDSLVLSDANLTPLTDLEIDAWVRNRRLSLATLESVYGQDFLLQKDLPPRNGDRMVLGQVTQYLNATFGDDAEKDVPRLEMSKDVKTDRAARIGDPRNDQTLMLSQLHVAFLRAHNNLVTQKHKTFDEAQTMLRQHYHWLILHDYLPTIADDDVVQSILKNQDPIEYPKDEVYLPLEFSAAAFRFGHGMIRDVYYINENFDLSAMDLTSLMMLVTLSNDLKPTLNAGSPTLRADKVIDWNRFLPGGKNVANRIGTRLSDQIQPLRDECGKPVPGEKLLAVQDLKRGYMFRLPTGQAIADLLGFHRLTPDEIRDAAKQTSQEQHDVIAGSKFLSERTPLWFYVLAEATHAGGSRLGPVGSFIVAKVLIELIRNSKDSILNPANEGWRPSMVEGKDDLNLTDFLRFAGVLEN
jgi:hypothetical protein